jgi:hypothetical protein
MAAVSHHTRRYQSPWWLHNKAARLSLGAAVELSVKMLYPLATETVFDRLHPRHIGRLAAPGEFWGHRLEKQVELGGTGNHFLGPVPRERTQEK